jgi:hypothetical protein
MMNWWRSRHQRRARQDLATKVITQEHESQTQNVPQKTIEDHLKLPKFADLPKVEGMPQGCAWGIFDKGDKKDVFGTLNLLTPGVIKAAATEVQEGTSISLK